MIVNEGIYLGWAKHILLRLRFYNSYAFSRLFKSTTSPSKYVHHILLIIFTLKFIWLTKITVGRFLDGTRHLGVAHWFFVLYHKLLIIVLRVINH